MTMFLKKIQMHAQYIGRIALICGVASGLSFFPLSGKGIAAKGDLEAAVKPYKITPTIITLGKAELIDVGGNVADILVADPNVIDVMAVQSNRLYVVGLNIGDTNLIAIDAEGNVVKKIDIHVSYDTDAIEAMIADLFPNQNVRVRAVHDQIILTGSADNPDVASRITKLVSAYVSDLQDLEGTADELIANLMDVRGEQQVMLQVKILEASRTVLKELGIETAANDLNELSDERIFGGLLSTNERGGGSLAAQRGGGITLSGDPAATARLLLDTGIGGIGTLGIFLNALAEENLVNILAEPNLTAVSGEQAGFLAGGEFPVPVGRDQVGNIVIEFREFGVSLNFKPIVLSDKRISLQMNTEVSSLDFENAVTLADLTVPGLDIRRADTTVEMPSGGSLMIAGLLQSEAVTGMQGLPGIKDTPILGDLVSSDSFRREETELVVIVTPYLVEPFADEKRAEKMPVHRSNPLAIAFADNIKKTFDIKDDDDLFVDDEQFGYLLD